MKRFEDVGAAAPEPQPDERLGVVLGDPRKRLYAAQLIGQAFVTAYNLVLANKDKVEAVANAVVEEKEIYGDDLIRLLDDQHFVRPEIDWTDEAVWPPLMNWSKLQLDGARTATGPQRMTANADDHGRDPGARTNHDRLICREPALPVSRATASEPSGRPRGRRPSRRPTATASSPSTRSSA